MSGITNIESWVGTSPSVVTVFVGHINSSEQVDAFINDQLTPIWERGHVPIVTWEPYMSGSLNQQNIVQLIRDGVYGHEIGEWAWKLSEWVSQDGNSEKRRLYMRFAHEMNTNWYPWSAGVAPEDYIQMWRSVHSIFSSLPFDQNTLQWMWSPNSEDFGGYAAEEYYPGDEYVDWIGIDGYNFGDSRPGTNWEEPEAIFGPMLERMRSLTDRPVALPEFASSSYREDRYQPESKDDWIRDVFALIRSENVKMHSWFNQDKETDWAVFGGARGTTGYTIDGTEYPVYEAYREALPSAITDGQEMTAEQFRGEF